MGVNYYGPYSMSSGNSPTGFQSVNRCVNRYSSDFAKSLKVLAGAAGFEPATYGFGDQWQFN